MRLLPLAWLTIAFGLLTLFYTMMRLPVSHGPVSSNSVRVATFNLWNVMFNWNVRKLAIRDMILELKPDVIGFQEMREVSEGVARPSAVGSHESRASEPSSAHTDQGRDSIIRNQLNELQALLPDYQWAVHQWTENKHDPEAAHTPGNSGSYQEGLAILSRHPIVASHHETLTTLPQDQDQNKRVVLWAAVDVAQVYPGPNAGLASSRAPPTPPPRSANARSRPARTGGPQNVLARIYFAVTHLSYSQPVQCRNTREVSGYLHQQALLSSNRHHASLDPLTTPPCPTVVVGDFNVYNDYSFPMLHLVPPPAHGQLASSNPCEVVKGADAAKDFRWVCGSTGCSLGDDDSAQRWSPSTFVDAWAEAVAEEQIAIARAAAEAASSHSLRAPAVVKPLAMPAAIEPVLDFESQPAPVGRSAVLWGTGSRSLVWDAYGNLVVDPEKPPTGFTFSNMPFPGMVSRPDRILVSSPYVLSTGKSPSNYGFDDDHCYAGRGWNAKVEYVLRVGDGSTYGSQYYWLITYTRLLRMLANDRDCEFDCGPRAKCQCGVCVQDAPYCATPCELCVGLAADMTRFALMGLGCSTLLMCWLLRCSPFCGVCTRQRSESNACCCLVNWPWRVCCRRGVSFSASDADPGHSVHAHGLNRRHSQPKLERARTPSITRGSGSGPGSVAADAAAASVVAVSAAVAAAGVSHPFSHIVHVPAPAPTRSFGQSRHRTNSDAMLELELRRGPGHPPPRRPMSVMIPVPMSVPPLMASAPAVLGPLYDSPRSSIVSLPRLHVPAATRASTPSPTRFPRPDVPPRPLSRGHGSNHGSGTATPVGGPGRHAHGAGHAHHHHGGHHRAHSGGSHLHPLGASPSWGIGGRPLSASAHRLKLSRSHDDGLTLQAALAMAASEGDLQVATPLRSFSPPPTWSPSPAPAVTDATSDSVEHIDRQATPFRHSPQSRHRHVSPPPSLPGLLAVVSPPPVPPVRPSLAVMTDRDDPNYLLGPRLPTVQRRRHSFSRHPEDQVEIDASGATPDSGHALVSSPVHYPGASGGGPGPVGHTHGFVLQHLQPRRDSVTELPPSPRSSQHRSHVCCLSRLPSLCCGMLCASVSLCVSLCSWLCPLPAAATAKLQQALQPVFLRERSDGLKLVNDCKSFWAWLTSSTLASFSTNALDSEQNDAPRQFAHVGSWAWVGTLGWRMLFCALRILAVCLLVIAGLYSANALYWKQFAAAHHVLFHALPEEFFPSDHLMLLSTLRLSCGPDGG